MRSAKVDFETARRVLACFDFAPAKLESFFPIGSRNCLGKLTNKILASPFGIVFDWRGEFNTEFLDPLCKMGPKLGINITYSYLEPPRDLAELTLITSQGTTKTVIEYDSNRFSVLLDGVRNLEEASGQRLVFRLLAKNHPSDTLCAAILSADRWEQVRTAAGGAFHDIFFVRRAEYEPTIGVPMDIANAVLRSLEEGKKIEAVMHYKKHTGVGAFEAKAGVERLASLRPMIESLMF
jgi:hypothetical protein